MTATYTLVRDLALGVWMFQLLRRLRAQRRRGIAMLVSVAMAVTAFLVLTASAESTSLRLTKTVDANFRSSYDLLVRPSGTRTVLERAQGLVRPNYLSGIFGGISRRQAAAVAATPGVEIAAPIAMVGTVLQSVRLPVDLTDDIGAGDHAAVRYSTTFVSQHGLTATPGQLGYVYVTSGQLRYRTPMDGPPYGDSEIDDGRRAMVCPEPTDTVRATSPFEVAARWSALCWSRSGGLGGQGWSLPGIAGMAPGHVGAVLTWSFPVTLAAVDPDAEARLTGLDGAISEGRYLKQGERAVDDAAEFATKVPVIMAQDALVDEQAVIKVETLPDAVAARIARGVGVRASRRLVLDAPATPVRRVTVDASTAYAAWRTAALYQGIGSVESFWTPSQVAYDQDDRGRLVPRTRRNDASVWQSPSRSTGFVAVPSDAADGAYRTLTQHQSDPNTDLRPRMNAVGTFDTSKLAGFSSLSQVPLETYQPPSAEPADAQTRRLLGDRDLLPNLNPAGYLQAPPLALTTLDALDTFTDAGRFPDVSSTAPISVIRIRVSGVTGTDEASRKRIELVASRLRERTGLDVDVTIGASPAPKTVELPPSAAGTPRLSILERWTKKGVAFALVDQIDRKSLTLFLLILVASALTVVNAANASVRSRRTEFGVLACLGWRRNTIYRSVSAELLVVGTVAGVLGTAVAVPVSALVDSPMPWARAALAIPAAIVLTVLAGLYPAWQASRVDPMEAIRPSVRPVRRAGGLHGVTSLALAALRRTPARSATGAAALGIGVCAMAVLVGILIGFHGAAVGTFLGDAVAVQVRTPDIVAAVVLAALAFIALADILYLDLHEQAPHYASLQAAGWRDGHLARLIVTQAGLIAALGGIAGLAAAAGILRLLAALTPQTLTVASGIACSGIVLSCVVALAPAATLTRLHPAEILAQE